MQPVKAMHADMADAAEFNMIVTAFLTRQKAKTKQSKAKQSKRKQKQHKQNETLVDKTKQNKKKVTQTKQIICVLIRNLGLIVIIIRKVMKHFCYFQASFSITP